MTRFTCVGCGRECLGPPDHPEATKACECPTRVVTNGDNGMHEWCDDGIPDWRRLAYLARAALNEISSHPGPNADDTAHQKAQIAQEALTAMTAISPAAFKS